VTLPTLQATQIPHGALHVLIDSTDLQVFGSSQWSEEKHGKKSRSTGSKLLLAVDAASGVIVAQTLADPHTDDLPKAPPLLDQIARVTADGEYDGAPPTYQTIAAYSDGVEVVIPPRSTATLCCEPGPPTQRDRHLQMIRERERLGWQVATRYGQRLLIETTMELQVADRSAAARARRCCAADRGRHRAWWPSPVAGRPKSVRCERDIA
jgi:Transposase DDE domain